MARHDIGYAFVDELNSQRYAKPQTSDLVRAGQHGVQVTYLRDMGALGYRLGSLAAIDRAQRSRDHAGLRSRARGARLQGTSRRGASPGARPRHHSRVRASHARWGVRIAADGSVDQRAGSRRHPGIRARAQGCGSRQGAARPADSRQRPRRHAGVRARHASARAGAAARRTRPGARSRRDDRVRT